MVTAHRQTMPEEDAEPDSVSGSPLGIGVATGCESELPFVTAAEIARMAPERVDWVIPGFVAPGVVLEIDGKLKASGKTTFAAELAGAVVNGTPFLNRTTNRSAIVWLTEERPQTFLETLRRAHLTERPDIHVLHWHRVKHRLWSDVMALAATFALRIGATVIIVDTISTWAGLRGDSENNNGDQLAAAEPLQDAAAKGLAVIVTRHERKGGGEVGESGRGGSAFSGAVDIIISIRRGEGRTKPTVRVLQALSRFSETPDSLVIDLTEHGYVVLGDQGTVATLEAEQTLLDRLPAHKADALDLETLRTVEPIIATTAAKAAVKNLLNAGQAGRLGHGKRGDPYRYFKTDRTLVATQIHRSDQETEME
jgi:hypothetical protein